MTNADVLVVGGGPTGLLLAGDLATAGIRTTLVERRAEESNLTRAFAVHARTLEQLDARGVADALVSTGTALDSLRLFGELGVDLSRLRTRFPYVLITPQYETERLLEDRAKAAGADLLRGTEVRGLRQDADGVELDTADGRVLRARYAVGCDGVHSTVRESLGVDFPGESVARSVMLADVRLTDAPPDVLTVGAGREGFAFLAPFGDGWYRAIAWNPDRQLPDDAPVDFEELRAVVRLVLGTDHGMHDPRWMSRFHSDERQVADYRCGRVLLAGDAAHVHSPAGGQGMNTGLQDAANLSWKLAAVIEGRADDALLDTYQAERHPVGRTVLRMSGALTRAALGQSARARLSRRVLPAVAGRVRPLTTRGARMISGIGIRYPSPRGSHPLIGRRLPDLRVDGGRLYEALRGGRFVLVADDARARRVAEDWAGQVRATAPAGHLRTAILVRPDGYAAWAEHSPEPAAVRAALREWCGSQLFEARQSTYFEEPYSS
ncbi:FAD-dependent monooxygenase [Actinacidiphila soli]|jgi:2-polyprenyl-6-methoxyphenol hydroxylase-like FAD-dependent oxidoreductase|uniref:FAD-dependent monooxygenase n=1 Tax=Actinacidiphila soli TaxID=2487275 RepID=UPI000FCC1CA4|nr:FAD-dependent monooxygenase [Actinacidiphila soli]